MSDERAWFSEMTKRNVTAIEIGQILNVSRNTAQSRLAKGLSSDELISVSRALGLSPIHALVELGHLTYDEVLDLIDGRGQLVETADPGYLALALARQLNPATKAPEIDELAARRSNSSTSRVVPIEDDVISEAAVADGSPDEDALRAQQEGGDWTDPDNIP